MIKIGDRKISKKHAPFIIAEMSGNHNKSLEKALRIVEKAAETGADAVKLQTYTPDTMTLNLPSKGFVVSDKESLWDKRSLYDLYKEAHTPWEWHEPIFKRARDLGLIVFSTPFDNTAVDFLEELDVPCYKVASFENTDIPLIKKIAETGKPIIISTGMASVSELDETVRTAKDHGAKDIVLLKCTSTYPAAPEHTNLFTIPHMNDLFDCEVGLSDHTLGIGVAVASVALGATVIEKHFTISRDEGGVDAAFSLEPLEMAALVKESKSAWQALGHIQYGPSGNEKKSKAFRRSLYIVKDMKKGETISTDTMRAIRPGYGLPCKYHDLFVGKKVNRDIKKGTPLHFDLIG